MNELEPLGPYEKRCSCGRPMSRYKIMCIVCRTDARRTTPSSPRIKGYYPRTGRYCLLAVSGFSTSERSHYGATFSILDGTDMWQEVERIIVNGKNQAADAREDLVRQVKRMNLRDAMR